MCCQQGETTMSTVAAKRSVNYRLKLTALMATEADTRRKALTRVPLQQAGSLPAAQVSLTSHSDPKR